MPTPTPPTVTPIRLTTSLAKRAALDFFLLAFFIVASLSVVAFAVSEQLLERHQMVQLQQAAGLTEDLVTRSLNSARERGRLLARDPQAVAMSRGEAPSGTAERWLLELGQNDDGLKGLAVFDQTLIRRAGAGTQVPPLVSIPRQTTLLPRLDADGWEWLDVVSPLHADDGTVLGAIVLRDSAATMLRPVTAALGSAGATATLELAFEQGGSLILVRIGADGRGQTLDLGAPVESTRQRLPAAAGALGEEGTGLGQDERGTTVLAAVRSIPELGWGLAIQIDRSEVFTEVTRLTAILGGVGGLLLVLGVLLSSLLSRSLTKHLHELIEKVSHLTPGEWQIERTIKSGDEIELLDHILVDVTGRLRAIYSHLEAEVERRTHEALELTALDRAVVESINYGVITVDQARCITACNPSAARLLQSTPNAIIGQSVDAVLRLTSDGQPLPDNQNPILESIQRRETTKSRVSQRLCLDRPQSAPLPIALTSAPLLVGNQLDGAVAVFEDVTEERQIDAMKTEFIDLAGHQLRTPISALRWHIELLEEGAETLTEEQRQSVAEMKTLAERTVRLLNTLLQSAKLDEGGIEPSWNEVDLTPLMRELSSGLGELAAQYKVEQTLELPSSLKLTTDQTLLSIVIFNLLTNAMKYSRKEQGYMLVQVRDAGDEVEIRIRDNGICIPEEDRSRLFEKFFRAKNARVIDTDGNGLGLYISQSILTRLQGRIAFESTTDKGTTFTVTLPKQPHTGKAGA